MEQLVQGVTLRRHGEYIESVSGKIPLHLVASWDGTEVIRQEAPAGARFGLRPGEGWNALECLYIQQGQATWSDGHRTLTLNPGDSVTGTPVKEPCILTALTDLVALYICSEPVFHQISGEVRTLQRLAIEVEMKDGYTRSHCRRIQHLSTLVGQALGLSPTRRHYLLYGSFFHDLGKTRVPDAILKKPGSLTPEEWTIMQQHTIWGRDLLLNTPLAGAAQILAQHHERLDGSGYPFGLCGDAISLEAQIVAVVDSYDAMTTDRIYRKGIPIAQAVDELRRCRGTLYLPQVVDAFIQVLEEHDGEIPEGAVAL
ncbi:MAG TPA: HD-GYP domain-containing protein [Symbiobacteriaceae bacterium]|nr:HD-GYP domain-containing protein [Symbiobacteriaceae bacterium]